MKASSLRRILNLWPPCDDAIEALRAAAVGGDKVLRWFEAGVVDAAGDVVARVRKQVYVRRKTG